MRSKNARYSILFSTHSSDKDLSIGDVPHLIGSFLSCPLIVIIDVEPQHLKAQVVVFHNRLGYQNVDTVMSHPCTDN
ncbi:hypothetical protein EYF80_052162 [Liparis tanakae]|uniref:Uncharacterized protein n=1 Tax=Liparis tanakae TaxID=230148 RepID=A0A4Z2F935_9TELE|nr:hypothetical protein EYF80_052162 [Liparis tanakae]